MEKGVSKYWTPAAEEYYKRLLSAPLTFAERDIIMSIRDLLKYDGRTKQAKRAITQARLRLATASDKDLEHIAYVQTALSEEGRKALITEGEDPYRLVASRLKELKETRAKIRDKGIKRSELECR